MNELLVAVIPLSIGALVSPTVLTAAVLVLSGHVAPRARAWAFTGGGAAALLGITLLAPLLAKRLQTVSRSSLAWMDVAFALLLLFVAARQALDKREPADTTKKRAPKHHTTPRPHLAEYFGFGAVMIATDFSSLVLYLAALKVVAHSTASVQEQIVAIAIPFVAVILPALVPAVVGSLAPQTADRILKPLAAWVGSNSRVIIIAISLVFAAYLLFKSVPTLLH